MTDRAKNGDNSRYNYGYSVGRLMHDLDNDLDFKEIDAELDELVEEAGEGSTLAGLRDDESFLEGVARGYVVTECTKKTNP